MTTKQNQKYTFTQKQSDSNRQAIIDNKPSEFKTTSEHSTELSMWDVAKSGPFACPCPLMYAEKYDEAMWYRARDEYLTQKKYEDDETIRELKQKIHQTQMTTSFPNLNLRDQVLYGALANSSGFGDGSGRSSINCIADRVRTAEEQIAELKKENEELKRKVLLQQEAGYYQRHTSTHGDINTDDAAFDHYWSVQDNDLTLWKVPRHLAEVKSAQTGYHGAVEQAFYDECFGEQYGKLKWMRVREMTQADLISGGWEPEADE